MKKHIKKLMSVILACGVVLSVMCMPAFAASSAGETYYGKTYLAKLTLTEAACESILQTNTSARLTMTGYATQGLGDVSNNKGLGATSVTGTTNGKTINPDGAYLFSSAMVTYTVDQVVEATLRETV